jgi:PAS domain S-box-containing protein
MVSTFLDTQQNSISSHLAQDGLNRTGIFLLVKLAAIDANTEEAQAWFLEEFKKLVNAESVILYLLDESNTQILTKNSLSEGGQWNSQVIPVDTVEEIIEAIRSKNQTVYLGNPDSRSFYLPLIADDKTIGAIAVETERFDLDERLLAAIGESLSNNLTKSKQARQAQEIIQAMESLQAQLLNSRNTLRALFDSSPNSIYIIDPGFDLIAINMKRADLIGRPPRELVGKQCFSVLYGRDAPCPGCLVGETIQTGNTTRRIERRWSPAQETIELEISTFPIWDNDHNIIQAFLYEDDVTERQQLQASLAQSEKLAAVGQLAAGVAHEINNPLTTIQANAQLLKRSFPAQDADLLEMIELIIEASNRASQAVRDLLDFARRERYEFTPTDVNETIHCTLALMGHELGSRSISLQFDPAMDLPSVNASQDHLQGVWLNLLMNAIDAISNETGKISIRTQKTDDAVQVLVSDNGQGIPPEKVSRIFEPFFTTKDPGQGTGLGLSVCHQIVTRHGGQIFVSSQLDVGTTFTVVLPLT